MSSATTVFATSLLFALMHGLGGGYLLELPHRFLMGVVFGLLRARCKSLVPAIFTHFLHNAVVALLL